MKVVEVPVVGYCRNLVVKAFYEVECLSSPQGVQGGELEQGASRASGAGEVLSPLLEKFNFNMLRPMSFTFKNRVVRFGPKVGQISVKWDTFGTFSDHIEPKCTEI